MILHDKFGRTRISDYSNLQIDLDTIRIPEKDAIFLKILKKFSLLSSNHLMDRRSLIVISSILEQASRYYLIKIDNNFRLLGFVNQRAGDYLVAYFLKISGLKTLQQEKINFWWSRPIAIAIAISEHPEEILKSIGKPKDFVIESAIIDGLTLIPTTKKSQLNKAIQTFSGFLLDEKRLFDRNSDPCDSLRALRGLSRLCICGYGSSLTISHELIQRLLNHKKSM